MGKVIGVILLRVLGCYVGIKKPLTRTYKSIYLSSC